jgi:16S rRNA (uracil1498-N3)-methyltransferase
MNRFFAPPDAVIEPGAIITPAPEDAAHIARVLRLGVGDRLIIIAGPGREALAEITVSDRKTVSARILALRTVHTEARCPVRLVQGVAKGEKMDYIVQKATELGVAEIVPVQTERAVVRLDAERGADKAQRWQRIAREAAQQCGRTVVPVVRPPRTLAEALAAPAILRLMPYEGEATLGLSEALESVFGNDGTHASAIGIIGESDWLPVAVAVFIGPEGGFAEAEVAAARAADCIPVSLGPRILRTETAGPAALTMILHQLGDLGQAIEPAGPWEE